MCVFCSPERSVGYHDLAFTSTAEASSLSEIKSLRTSSKLLLRLHGSFMIVAWIGAASIGIVIARYYRQTWVGASCCSKDLWFGVSHATSSLCYYNIIRDLRIRSDHFSNILFDFLYVYTFYEILLNFIKQSSLNVVLKNCKSYKTNRFELGK